MKKVSLGRTVRLRKGNYWKFDCSLYIYIYSMIATDYHIITNNVSTATLEVSIS